MTEPRISIRDHRNLIAKFVLPLVLFLSIGAAAQEPTSVVETPLTLEQLLELAQHHNPTLRQAVALIEGEEGKAKQAGLWPNPTLNYIGEQITEDGTAGEFQGGSIRQRIVTGGKLALSRQKYEARTDVARRNLTAQEFRVRNDVETSYYESLGAQAKLKLYDDLLNIAKDHYQTTVELVNIGNLSHADLEKAGVMLQKARLDRFMAENELRSRRLSLEAVVGVPLESAPLVGSLENEVEVLPDWEPLLARTIAESPQVLAALDKLRSDEITVRRERVEPIPDIVLEVGAGHNFIADQTVYMAGVSLEIPIFDRNQGTIRQAQADLERQKAEVERVRLHLSREFGKEYSMYLTSFQKVLDYRGTILPKSRTAFELELESYKARRINWPEVLVTQEMYITNRLEFVDHLVDFHRHRVSLAGFLLQNGLQVPDSPTPPSHIDSVPKPR